ncbi:hypothetical protein [Streptomyces collinus]|nr:hypothetical protein [Streptomyces collinus]
MGARHVVGPAGVYDAEKVAARIEAARRRGDADGAARRYAR